MIVRKKGSISLNTTSMSNRKVAPIATGASQTSFCQLQRPLPFSSIRASSFIETSVLRRQSTSIEAALPDRYGEQG